MSYQIRLTNVKKHYGSVPVLKGIEWTVKPRSVAALLGASGTGKTTLLRLIAGLEEPSGGQVLMLQADGAEPPDPPRIGMLFQNLALWPHLTAMQHVQCVLWPLARRQRRRRAESLLGEARLPSTAWCRRPAELSGGEAQRLALARALASEPEILLLDEPLANVDTVLRAELSDLLVDVIRRRQTTVVYVTHHWDEAMQLADRIAVIQNGRIVADGTPDDVYWNPPDVETARLTGPVVELPRRLLEDGFVASEKRVPSLAAASVEDDGPFAARPQQLWLIAAGGRNRWTVATCRPQHAGWLVLLVNEDRRLTLTSSAPHGPNETVGVELRSPHAVRTRRLQ